MSFYAVANGRNRGIFTTWKECSESVKGFKNSSYKKFSSKLEAEDYILNYNNESQKYLKMILSQITLVLLMSLRQ